MYNYYPQQFPTRQVGLKGQPVSSIDEVKAMSIDFDGSIFYFPDLGNNRIYTKQINLDGTMSLNMYELKQLPQQLTTDYITREEFNNSIKEFKELLEKQNAASSNAQKTAMAANF